VGYSELRAEEVGDAASDDDGSRFGSTGENGEIANNVT